MPIPVPFIPHPFVPGPSHVRPELTLTRGEESLPLSISLGWIVRPGVNGLDDPPRSLTEVDPATGDGSILTDVRYNAREVFIPLTYKASSPTDLRETMRALATMTDIKAGDVTLEIAHFEGTRRYIDGRMSVPFGVNAMDNNEGGYWRTIGLTMRCFDPFFYGEQRSIGWVIGGDTVEFLSDEFLPVGLDNSQVLGSAVIDNSGDAHAYPVWTVTGPCDELTLIAGDTFAVVPDGLLDTETLVIDSRRGVKTFEIDGSAAWGRLQAGSVFGTLAPGLTLIDGEAVGATSDTTITVAWRERWLTAW